MAINPTPASITAGTLDAWEYLASYVDLMSYYGADQAGAANHYNLTGGPIEGRSITFNAWAYLASYVDLMSYFGYDAIGAAMHYVVTGHPVEGRTVTFDAQAYLDANPDLQEAYGGDADGGLSNASRHYVVTGRTEIADGLRESGLTFVLTAGVDLFPGGLDNRGNDTIIGEGGTLNPGDDLDGGIGTDTMRVKYAVSDLNQTLESLFDHADISNIEVLEFDTNDDISFQANTADAADSSAGGDYDFTTFTLGSGDDTIEFNGETAAAYTVNGGVGNDMVIDRIGGANGANDITFIGGTSSDDVFEFTELTSCSCGSSGTDDDTMGFISGSVRSSNNFAPGGGCDTVLVIGTGSDIAAGDIADLVTDGALEVVKAIAGTADIRVRVNNDDLHDFSGQVANYDLDAADDIFFSASEVNDGTEGVNVCRINAGGHILAVGGAGDDIFTIESGNTSGTAGSVDGATDAPGVLGLRGADTINLEAGNTDQDNVVYKTAQDGNTEKGASGFEDHIYNFVSGEDKIVFALNGGAYSTTAETGTGAWGSQVDQNQNGIVDAALDDNPIVIILGDSCDTSDNGDELALYSATYLIDDELLDLDMVADYVASATSLMFDDICDTIVLAVHGDYDTGIYWFTSEDADASVSADELTLVAIVEDELLSSGAQGTANDFAVL